MGENERAAAAAHPPAPVSVVGRADRRAGGSTGVDVDYDDDNGNAQAVRDGGRRGSRRRRWRRRRPEGVFIDQGAATGLERVQCVVRCHAECSIQRVYLCVCGTSALVRARVRPVCVSVCTYGYVHQCYGARSGTTPLRRLPAAWRSGAYILRLACACSGIASVSLHRGCRGVPCVCVRPTGRACDDTMTAGRA